MPRGQHRGRPFAREQAGLGKTKRHRGRQDERGRTLVAALAGEDLGFERVMERKRAAGQSSHGTSVRQMPAKDAGAMADSTLASCSSPAFKQRAQSAGQKLEMTARNRHRTILADFERRHRDMGGGIAVAVERRHGIEFRRREQIVERHHAVGKIDAEAADIADRKHFRGDVHGKLTMLETADAAAGDQRFGADPRQRRDHIGAPPQQRQRRRDQSGAQHAENGQNILDDVRHLDADDGVGRQSHAAQPAGDRRDHAVGLGIGQPQRRPVGKFLPVRRVGERDRPGPPRRRAAKQFVERDTALTSAARRLRRLWEPRESWAYRSSAHHCRVFAGCRHQVSGR